jgi:hypothetical protein
MDGKWFVSYINLHTSSYLLGCVLKFNNIQKGLGGRIILGFNEAILFKEVFSDAFFIA